jgi:threonine dehydrogenase-like Zn-dependent dehydrogenase
MDGSFGATPLAMQEAICLMEREFVDPGKIIGHRFALADIHKAGDIMGQPQRNKVKVVIQS